MLTTRPPGNSQEIPHFLKACCISFHFNKRPASRTCPCYLKDSLRVSIVQKKEKPPATVLQEVFTRAVRPEQRGPWQAVSRNYGQHRSARPAGLWTVSECLGSASAPLCLLSNMYLKQLPLAFTPLQLTDGSADRMGSVDTLFQIGRQGKQVFYAGKETGAKSKGWERSLNNNRKTRSPMEGTWVSGGGGQEKI